MVVNVEYVFCAHHHHQMNGIDGKMWLKQPKYSIWSTVFWLSYRRFTNNKINKLFDCAPKQPTRNKKKMYERMEKSKDGEKELNERVLSCHVTCFWWKKKTQNVQKLFFRQSLTRMLLVLFVQFIIFYIDVGSGGMRYKMKSYVFLCLHNRSIKCFVFFEITHTPTHQHTHTCPKQNWTTAIKIQKYSPIHTHTCKAEHFCTLSFRPTDRNSNKSLDRCENNRVHDFMSMSIDVRIHWVQKYLEIG